MQYLFTDTTSSLVSSERVLYTPSPFAKTSLLHLQEMGTLQAKKQHVSGRSNLDSYLFFYVSSGSGKLSYGEKEYKLQTGDCVFIDCNKKYSHETDKDNLWNLSWIHFYGAFLPSIYEKYTSRGGKPVFHPENTEPFERIFKKLLTVASSTDYIRDMRINEHLGSLLTLVMEESWNPTDKKNHPTKKDVSSIREYLDQHYAEKITLDELAAKFYINKYYLTRVFKEQYGISINNYLQRVRITKAKQMLRFTDEKIETIGLKCGLGAPNYFSRIFKNVEGISPSKYREKW